MKIELSDHFTYKKLFKFTLPSIFMMIFMSIYGVVDGLFVSHFAGKEEFTAVNFIMPFLMILGTLGFMFGAGGSALIAKTMGEGNKEKASATAGNGVFLGIVITVVFMLFGAFGAEAYIGTQTSDTVIREMAVTYLRICCICSVGIVFFSVFEKLLQAAGLSMQSTIAQISGAIINIILDPMMIYGLIGFPKMGVAGAALATVIGQVASFLLALIFHLKYNKSVQNGLRYIRPDKTIIKLIYKIGHNAHNNAYCFNKLGDNKHYHAENNSKNN